MELKLLEKREVEKVTVSIIVGDAPVHQVQVYPNERFNPIALSILLAEVVSVEDKGNIVVGAEAGVQLAELLSLEKVAADQERAVDELRDENEELKKKLEAKEKELTEAQESNGEWAKKVKTLNDRLLAMSPEKASEKTG